MLIIHHLPMLIIHYQNHTMIDLAYDFLVWAEDQNWNFNTIGSQESRRGHGDVRAVVRSPTWIRHIRQDQADAKGAFVPYRRLELVTDWSNTSR